MAASHSGSTLTAMLLNSHSDVYTAGELKVTSLGNVDKYRCSCRTLLKECVFWEKVNHSMKTKGYDFKIAEAGTDFKEIGGYFVRKLLGPLYRGIWLEWVRDAALWLSPSWRRVYPKKLKINEDLIHSVSEVAGTDKIVDSSKIGLRYKFIKRIKSIEIKVIRIVRDGRAVALTYIDPENFADAENAEMRCGGMGGNRDHEKKQMHEAAREWLRSNEEAEAVIRTLNDDQWIQIRYEDLCTNPDEILNKIFRFIGVDPSKRIENFRNVEHHVIGNGMRLDKTNEVVLDERWKTSLSEKDLKLFSEIAGEKNRELGYLD